MSDRLFVATRKGVFRLDRSEQARTWKVSAASFLGDNATYVLPDNGTGRMFVSLEHGHFGPKLHRSQDHGETWEECAAPQYPPRAEGAPDEVDGFGKVIPQATQLIWVIEHGGPGRENVVWAGTIPGGLFRSDNGGDTWELNRSLWDRPERKNWFGGGRDIAGIHSVCIDPRNADWLTVGVSCGGAWRSENAGATWRCSEGMRAEYMPPERQFDPTIQDPHIVVQSPSNPDVFWAQHHNGVFQSTDGLASWHEIKDIAPSTFGFAAAIHPGNADTAWLVPAIKDEKRIPVDGKVVVTRTRDGGKSFEQLTRGLPQEHAYDLVFRHGLDVDESGDRLAMGSTTGTLWISEDQGDSWEAITHHLPPIHCVRFAK